MAVNPSIQLGTSGNWAIKEDNLLAYKQLGSKFFDREFDFSRGTRATFVGRNGLIQESGLIDTELVTNGDFATDSDWTKTNATISNGLATITVTNGGYSALSQSITYATGKKYIITAQIQGLSGSSGKQIKFQDKGDNTGGLNLSNGLITLNETLQNIEINWTANSNSNIIVITRQSNSGDYSFTIDNVSIKEIQLDVPRIDFTDDPTGHLLLEPQSTNLWRNSEGSDITLTSPLGTFGFYNVTSSQASNSEAFTAGTIVSATFIVKKADGTTPTVTASGSNGDIIFRITGTSNAGVAGALTDIGNGFYTYKLENYSVSGSNSDNRISNNSGDVVYVSLIQLEQKSYATSYIPTSGSAVTRNQEICNNSGTVNDFNSEEGVLYAEIAALANDGTDRVISLSDGTNTRRVLLAYTAVTNQIQAFSNNGVDTVNLIFTVSNVTNFNKIAFKYKLNDFALWIDGAEVSTNSSGTTNVANTLNNFKFENASGTSDFYGKTKNLKVFKRALTDAELYLLTVIQYQSYQEMATALNYTL